jgi:hypothetical protein
LSLKKRAEMEGNVCGAGLWLEASLFGLELMVASQKCARLHR